jgi:hypothetical protein
LNICRLRTHACSERGGSHNLTTAIERKTSVSPNGAGCPVPESSNQPPSDRHSSVAVIPEAISKYLFPAQLSSVAILFASAPANPRRTSSAYLESPRYGGMGQFLGEPG